MPLNSSTLGSKQFIKGSAMDDDNLVRLKLVMALFRIRPILLCKGCKGSKGKLGYSKAYISGILSGAVKPSSEFILRLNASLLDLITQSGGASSVFNVPSVKVDGMQPMVDSLRKSA